LYSRHFLLQLFEIPAPLVGKVSRPSMNACTKTRFNPVLLGQLQQGMQMFLLRVHSAIGHQSEEMQSSATRAGMFHGPRAQRWEKKSPVAIMLSCA